MKFFRNNDKLKEMLKQSQRDFSFDQKAVKQTVLAHAGTHQPVLLAMQDRGILQARGSREAALIGIMG